METLASKLLRLPQRGQADLSEDEISNLYNMGELLGKLEILEVIKGRADYTWEEEMEVTRRSLLMVSKEVGMFESGIVEVIMPMLGVPFIDEEKVRQLYPESLYQKYIQKL